MQHIRRNAAIVILALCVLSGAGCLKLMYYVQFEDDGRGRVTEVVKIERKVLMLEQSIDTPYRAQNLLTEANAKKRAELMNCELGFFEVKMTDDGGLEATAVYTFEHINNLKLCMYPWPTQESNDYWQKADIVFEYGRDEVLNRRYLWIEARTPERRGGEPVEPGSRKTPAELQQIRRLLPIFRDLLSGFQLFLRIQVSDKDNWYKQERPDYRGPSGGDWDGQYTPLSITAKNLIFDEDVLMYVVPWEIVSQSRRSYWGGYRGLRGKMEDVRYHIATQSGAPYTVGQIAWNKIRVDGKPRYKAYFRDWDQEPGSVSRELPAQILAAPLVELPPVAVKTRYRWMYLGKDMRLLGLQKKADVPANFMQPDFDDSGWRKIDIFAGAPIHPEPFLLYRKRFTFPGEWDRKVCQLRFEGVRDRCIVYLNGKEVGRHDGWDKRFYLDAAEHVNFGGENLLAVYVENLTDVGGIWKEVDIGDLRLTSEFHLTKEETLAEESEAQKALRGQLPNLPGIITFQMHSPSEPENKENWDIFTIKPDGTELKAIVSHEAADVHPHISPDGKQVLFLSLREHWDEILKMRKLPPNHWEEYGVYYTIDIEGKGPPRRLWPAAELGSDACWSPDGKAIAFAQHDPPRINIKRLDTGKVITHTPPDAYECASPTFSPDGKQLIFIDLENPEGVRYAHPEAPWGRARVAYLAPNTYDLVGKRWGELAETLEPDRERHGNRAGPHITRAVSISPNGKYLAFNTTRRHWRWGGQSYLFDTMVKEGYYGDTLLGFIETEMLNPSDRRPERRMYNECPAWSPDSRYILFIRGPDNDEARHFHFTHQFHLVDWMDLYLADPRGKRCVRLTWLKQRMGCPDWWVRKTERR